MSRINEALGSSDPVNGIKSNFAFDAGAGVYWTNGKMSAGAAVTNLIGSKLNKISDPTVAKVSKLYKQARGKGYNKKDASPYIEEHLNLKKVLKRSSKNWDGGYAMAGLVGHGDAFVLRDPNGIRPTYFYEDDEVVVVASERPVIQTVFNVNIEDVQE